jgi:DNA-binding LytR/AlgR family response regulator
MAPRRILVHISRSEHRVLDPDDVYYLQASGGETEIRLRSRTPLIDIRPIGEVAPLFQPHGFVRTHRKHVVNIAHVRLLRLQADGRDWELKLEPPVNKVLPIARDRLGTLRDALGESGISSSGRNRSP